MFLTSPQVLGLPNLDDVTYLDDSLFVRFQDGRVVFCRESISAVLLFYISKFHAEATGLLHPKPAYNTISDIHICIICDMIPIFTFQPIYPI